MPVAVASIIYGGAESQPVGALLDTGSAINIVDMDFAEVCLGKTKAEIKKGPSLSLGGMGGAKQWGFGWKVNVRLKATPTSTESLILRDAWIYACELKVPGFVVLIGQHSGLEERWFRHHNHPTNRHWLIYQGEHVRT